MNATIAYSLEELVAAVNAWCVERGLAPANGQSAEQLSPRTLRYYRTMGLLAAPKSGGSLGYGEIHRLQLSAIRMLQAHGFPLRRIQTLLYGRSMADLRTVVEKGLVNAPRQKPLPPMAVSEDWKVSAIDDSVWLILRHGRTLMPDQIARIQAIVNPPPADETLQLKNERKS